MPTPAGTELTVLQPWVYYAPRGTVVPKAAVAFRAPWAAPWARIERFNEEMALMVNFSNPRIKVRTQDKGVIATLGSGEEGISITTGTKTPDWQLLAKMNNLVTSIAEAIAANPTATPPVEGRPKLTGGYFEPNKKQPFMLGIEGISPAGGFFEEDHIVRAFAYNVEVAAEEGGGGRGGGGGGGGGGRRGGGGGGGGGGQAQPGQIAMNYSGEQAYTQLAIQVECQPEPNLAAVYEGTDYPSNLVDPYKRFNWWNIEKAAETVGV